MNCDGTEMRVADNEATETLENGPAYLNAIKGNCLCGITSQEGKVLFRFYRYFKNLFYVYKYNLLKY